MAYTSSKFKSNQASLVRTQMVFESKWHTSKCNIELWEYTNVGLSYCQRNEENFMTACQSI